jgi:hypothetical protein
MTLDHFSKKGRSIFNGIPGWTLSEGNIRLKLQGDRHISPKNKFERTKKPAFHHVRRTVVCEERSVGVVGSRNALESKRNLPFNVNEWTRNLDESISGGIKKGFFLVQGTSGSELKWHFST